MTILKINTVYIYVELKQRWRKNGKETNKNGMEEDKTKNNVYGRSEAKRKQGHINKSR